MSKRICTATKIFSKEALEKALKAMGVFKAENLSLNEFIVDTDPFYSRFVCNTDTSAWDFISFGEVDSEAFLRKLQPLYNQALDEVTISEREKVDELVSAYIEERLIDIIANAEANGFSYTLKEVGNEIIIELEQ